MSRLPPVPLIAVALCLGTLGVACAPKIGDDCSSSTDCSQNGDRLCDTTQPGGYCTVFNCEPDTCPEEAQCVAFDQTLDPACVDPQSWARFERTFCMRRCDNDGDCRSGYVCYDMRVQPNPWGAKIVDLSPDGYKICISPSSGAPPSGLTEVCSPYDGGFPDAAWSTPDSSTDAPDDAPGDAPDAAPSDDGSVDAPADDAAGDAAPDAPDDASGDAPDAAPSDDGSVDAPADDAAGDAAPDA